MSRKRIIPAVLAAALAVAPGAAAAQGFATWLGDRVGLGNVGRTIDNANREAKKVVPLYGQAEETVTNAGRHLITEATVETTAPALKNMILWSRNDALNAGAGPLPPEVMWDFQGFYSPAVLNSRWRVGQGHELSLQANSFRFGDRAAIALDTVVVFRSMGDAYSPWLWAHELAHIEQYRNWGVDDFTKRYIRDADAIEAAANARADEFMRYRARRMASTAGPGPRPVSGPPLPPVQQMGMFCATPAGSCPMATPFPRGGACWCPSFQGPVVGQVP